MDEIDKDFRNDPVAFVNKCVQLSKLDTPFDTIFVQPFAAKVLAVLGSPLVIKADNDLIIAKAKRKRNRG